MSEISAIMATILKNDDYNYECNENNRTALYGGK